MDAEVVSAPANLDADRYAHPDRYALADADRYAHSHPYADPNQYAHFHPYADAGEHPHAHTDAHPAVWGLSHANAHSAIMIWRETFDEKPPRSAWIEGAYSNLGPLYCPRYSATSLTNLLRPT